MKQWASNNFNKGLNTKDNPAMLGLNELSEATNVVVEDGKIKFREGYSDKSSLTGYVSANSIHGLVEYNDTTTPANNKMIYALGTDLKTGSTVLDNDINATNYVNFSKFTNNEKLYYVDGEHAVKSLFENYLITYSNGEITALHYGSYIYLFNGITYAVTTSTSRKIERWKLTGSTWAYDKDISTALGVGEFYNGFCWDGTYYYAVRSDTKKMEKWDDTPSLIYTFTIEHSFTMYNNINNQCVYDSYNKNIILMSLGNSYGTSTNMDMYLIKINTTSGYISKIFISESLSGGIDIAGSIALNFNTLYYKKTTDDDNIYKVSLFGTFTEAASILCDIKGKKIGNINNYLVVFNNDTTIENVRFYDSTLSLVRTEYPTILTTEIHYLFTTDNSVDDIYFYGRDHLGALRSFVILYTNTAYFSHVYTPYTFIDIPVSVTVTSSITGIFRTGNWYFAYRIGNKNSQSGIYEYTQLSTPVIANVAAALANVSLIISNIVPTSGIVKWYARHETESYFYEIGDSNTNTFIPTSLQTSLVYDETTVYSPPPVGTTQTMSYRDMMVYVKDNSLYFSNYFDPINCPTTIATDTASGLGGYYPIGKENNAITGIYQLHGYLFVFKSHYTYLISGDPGELATFRIDLISDKVGAKNERCITDDGSFIYVYCDTGIYPINENGIGKSLTEYVEKDVLANYATSGYDHALCYHQKLNRLMLLERP